MGEQLAFQSIDYWRKDNNRLPLLDVRKKSRSLDPFEKEDAVIVHIPEDEIHCRNFELPPRNIAFSLLLDKSCDVKHLEKLLLSRKPWNIAYGILLTDNDDSTDTKDRQRQPPKSRLWEPDGMIRDILLPELAKLDHIQEIWDLGAGAGRDACFLAEALPKVTVMAYDHRYRTDHDPIHAFFKRRGVASNTKVCCANVTDLEDFPCQCVYMVRYWNRPLAERIAKDAGVSTIIAVSQFGKPRVGAPWPFPHPKVS